MFNMFKIRKAIWLSPPRNEFQIPVCMSNIYRRENLKSYISVTVSDVLF
jgi:hypothetical protein